MKGKILQYIAVCVLAFLGLTACGAPEQSPGLRIQLPPTPSPGVTVIVDYARPAPVLGVVIDERERVLHIEFGSTAALGGVRVGDTLVGVNGIDLTAPDGRARAKALLGETYEGDTLRLDVVRDGQQVRLDVVAMGVSPRADHATPTPVVQPNDYL